MKLVTAIFVDNTLNVCAPEQEVEQFLASYVAEREEIKRQLESLPGWTTLIVRNMDGGTEITTVDEYLAPPPPDDYPF